MWRQDGVPDNPAAWLHTAARYLAVDQIRRRDSHRNKVRLVAATSSQVVEHDLAELVDGDLADDLLGLIFMAAHPILSPDARSALTLKLVCGLATEDIARAFLRTRSDYRPARGPGKTDLLALPRPSSSKINKTSIDLLCMRSRVVFTRVLRQA
jgi:predicted RNA polymerase sigma factor